MAMLRGKKVDQEMGCGKTTRYDQVRRGLLTRPVKLLGARASGWPEYEIQAILAARVAGRTDNDIRELVRELHARRAAP